MTEVVELARAARVAARQLAVIDRAHKDAALHAMADALAVAADEVLAANASDVARARAAGTSEALIDRLSLTQPRIDSMVAGLRSLASLPDPIGEVVRGWQLANGVHIDQVRVPRENLLNRYGDVAEDGTIESQPRQDGRNMLMVLAPTRKKAEAREQEKADKADKAAQRQADAEAEAREQAEMRAAHQAKAEPKKKRGPADNLDPDIDV